MSEENRADLLSNAVLFLLDPKVQSSPLTSRIQFLEGKGLNEHEIQEALKRAQNGNASDSSPRAQGGVYTPAGPPPGRLATADGYGYGYGQQVAPPVPGRDWRDVFIMAVISGGVVYGLTALARKYLVPHLQPPSTTTFQETSGALSAQYDEAQSLLNQLSEETTALTTSLEADRERVNGVVEEVERAVESVRAGEDKWREEMREIRGEVEQIRELVPKMIEKHAQGQSASLADLQNELRSLKTLLQARTAVPHSQPPAAAQSPVYSAATPSTTDTPERTASPSTPVPHLAHLASSSATTNGSAAGSGEISATTAAANALLAPKSRGIPAWQKAAVRSTSSTSVSGTGEASTSGSEST